MDPLSLAIIAGGLLAYSLISGRLTGTIITAPLVFVFFGLGMGAGGLGIANIVSRILTLTQEVKMGGDQAWNDGPPLQVNDCCILERRRVAAAD